MLSNHILGENAFFLNDPYLTKHQNLKTSKPKKYVSFVHIFRTGFQLLAYIVGLIAAKIAFFDQCCVNFSHIMINVTTFHTQILNLYCKRPIS